MSIDERLEQLAKRHESLARTVELLTSDINQLRAMIGEDAENIRSIESIARIEQLHAELTAKRHADEAARDEAKREAEERGKRLDERIAELFVLIRRMPEPRA